MSEDTHNHKFLHSVKADFEPASFLYDDEGHEITSLAGQNLYRRVEYSFSGCNCGAAMKTRVKTSDFNA